MSIHFRVYNPQRNLAFPVADPTESSLFHKWLDQYYQIREICFRRELGIPDFDGSEDIFDKTGYILLMIADGICVGGVRLNESTAERPAMLPLESDDFLLRQAFPELNEMGVRYSQWTRLAVHEGFRTNENLLSLAEHMSKMYRALGHNYSFNVSGTNRARFYRRLHRSQGHSCEIRRDVELPQEDEFLHLEHLLSVAYIKPLTESLVYLPVTIEEPELELIPAVA